MTPAVASEARRWVRRLREIRGSPSWSSLKRWLPFSSSRRMSGVQRSAKISAPRETGQNWPYSGTRPVNAQPHRPASSLFGIPPHAPGRDGSKGPNRHLGGTLMRQIGPITLALVLVTCGGAPERAASSATPSATPSPTVAAVATPLPTYPPSAEGFNSKLLVEKPRNVSTSATGYVWIVTGATTDGSWVSATVSESESFTASYQASTDRRGNDAGRVVYATTDLPPLAVGRYTESLRLVVLQPGGRSARAHALGDRGGARARGPRARP